MELQIDVYFLTNVGVRVYGATALYYKTVHSGCFGAKMRFVVYSVQRLALKLFDVFLDLNIHAKLYLK